MIVPGLSKIRATAIIWHALAIICLADAGFNGQLQARPWRLKATDGSTPSAWRITDDPSPEPILDDAKSGDILTSAPQSSQVQSAADQPVTNEPWIVGVGGGARVGAGEPTYPMVYGRLGRQLSPQFSLSLRPRYIFGDSDLQGESNQEGSFQMPLTIDLYPASPFSPYAGAGIATNTDSTGRTDAMLSFGADINFTEVLSIDIGLNYIFQSSDVDQNGRDIEFTSVLYLKF